MILKSLNISLIAFIAWPWALINAQQYASLQLDAYNDTFLIAVNDESFITEGDVAEDSVVLIDFNGGENIQFDFIIDSALWSTDDFFASLEDESGDIFYGYRVEGGDIQIIDIHGTVSLGVFPGSYLPLRIVRCGDYIFYIHENEVILCREAGDTNLQFNGQVQVFEALDADIDIGISSGMECDYICEQIQENFLALENFIEWREHVIVEKEIRFKYVEKYAMTEENEDITCRLINNATGEELISYSLHNDYGINLKTWDVSTEDLTTGATYIFHVSGMNKGREYKIRIRYDGE